MRFALFAMDDLTIERPRSGRIPPRDRNKVIAPAPSAPAIAAGQAPGRYIGEYLVAVKLRLKRFGRKHRSFYRLGAVDSRCPRDGRVIEELGWYDPEASEPEKQVSLKRERIEEWLKQGAQPTETVADLLKRNGRPTGR